MKTSCFLFLSFLFTTITHTHTQTKQEVSKSSGVEFLKLKLLPAGIYHLALIVNENVIYTSKIFKTN